MHWDKPMCTGGEKVGENAERWGEMGDERREEGGEMGDEWRDEGGEMGNERTDEGGEMGWKTGLPMRSDSETGQKGLTSLVCMCV